MASTANIIIAQRLVRKLHKDSKEPYHLKPAELTALSDQIDVKKVTAILETEGLIKKGGSLEQVEFFRPKPSADCPDGFRGRVGIYEILPITENIRELINKRASMDEIDARGKQEGMLTMREDGFIKAARGVTSIEAVFDETSE